MRTVQSEHDPFLRDFWREESARLYWETDFTEVVDDLPRVPRQEQSDAEEAGVEDQR